MEKQSRGFGPFAAVFVLLALIGAAALFGLGGAVPGRAPAPFPLAADSTFMPAFDTWLTDRVPFRAAMIRAASFVREHVFRTGSDEVIVGEDGFLFFAETVPDYCGLERMSDTDVALTVDRLTALSDRISASGGRLLLAVAPNKNTVYPDKMPAAFRSIAASAPSDTDRLYDALAVRGVGFADLRPALRGTETLTYHKRDTHWNGMGAALAIETIMDALSLPYEPYSALSVVSADGFVCDLDELLYPGAGHTFGDLVPDADLASAYVFTSAASDSMSLRLATRGEGKGRLLVWRDSFGSALIPYLSAAFEEVRYERGEPYDLTLIDTYRPDVVLIVIAERNLPSLIADLAAVAP